MFPKGPFSAGFFDGTATFNVISFLLSSVGLIVGVCSLWVAIWQIKKSRAAAEAAANAANQVALRLGRLTAFVEMTRVCTSASEVIQLLRGDLYAMAALRSQLLLRELGAARSVVQELALISESDWQSLVTEVAVLQTTLESFSSGRKPSAAAIARCREKLLSVEANLHTIAAKAQRSIGAE